MFHLNRWNQFQLHVDNFDSYSETDKVQLKQKSQLVFNQIKKNDILNIYGENPMSSSQLMDILKYTKNNHIFTRIWMSQWIDQIDETDIEYFVDELVIWCPDITKESFNLVSGTEYFDIFYSKVNQMKIKTILSLTVRQTSLEDLPEFYDLVYHSGSYGMILYVKSEFTSEQLEYIKRFKKVSRMRIVEIKNTKTDHCLSMPNIIGTASFEWQDWKFAIRESLASIPLLKYTIS